MKAYLVQFTYEYYCQGREEGNISVLVYAPSYGDAIFKISEKYDGAKNFENLTLE